MTKKFALKLEQNIESLFVALIAALILMQFQNCGGVSFSSSSSQRAHALGQCSNQSYQQPNATITNKVDILIVLHDTGSFAGSAYADVAGGMQSFVNQLPANADYRISTISALDPVENANAGQVYGTVFTSSNITANAIANQLKNPNTGTNHGEFGMAALKAALTTQRSYNAGQMALRPGAALAVFFMGNEADICGEPETDPGTDSDWAGEVVEKHNYCSAVTPDTVIAAIQNYANSNGAGYIVGGVTFTDMATRDLNGIEREYGWGYNELVRKLNGPLVDLNSGDAAIANGIGAVGNLAGQLFNVKTDFVLTLKSGDIVDPSTVSVLVDGAAISSSYISYAAANADVHISNPAYAGSPGSNVTVNYCTQ